MVLPSRTKLGPYEIHSLLGAGGMGEVVTSGWGVTSPLRFWDQDLLQTLVLWSGFSGKPGLSPL